MEVLINSNSMVVHAPRESEGLTPLCCHYYEDKTRGWRRDDIAVVPSYLRKCKSCLALEDK